MNDFVNVVRAIVFMDAFRKSPLEHRQRDIPSNIERVDYEVDNGIMSAGQHIATG